MPGSQGTGASAAFGGSGVALGSFSRVLGRVGATCATAGSTGPRFSTTTTTTAAASTPTAATQPATIQGVWSCFLRGAWCGKRGSPPQCRPFHWSTHHPGACLSAWIGAPQRAQGLAVMVMSVSFPRPAGRTASRATLGPGAPGGASFRGSSKHVPGPLQGPASSYSTA
ncbi:hypothetical protein [Nonomuraea sp. KM88]|uniref:hypothetical protein n=1 Tax=Nonomuraea sp. KM88 TaxID=3457427 RepID=UPI003FCE543F